LPKPPHHQSVKPRLRKHARTMRRISTDAEQKLWFLLRDRRLDGIKFRRQVPFKNYILDFVCFERKLVVEIDGGQHTHSGTDRARDGFLRAEGFHVARYWNNDVLQNPEGVLIDLLDRLASSDPSPNPPCGHSA
jgi:very-short-patch-repair endonuclease